MPPIKEGTYSQNTIATPILAGFYISKVAEVRVLTGFFFIASNYLLAIFLYRYLLLLEFLVLTVS